MIMIWREKKEAGIHGTINNDSNDMRKDPIIKFTTIHCKRKL